MKCIAATYAHYAFNLFLNQNGIAENTISQRRGAFHANKN